MGRSRTCHKGRVLRERFLVHRFYCLVGRRDPRGNAKCRDLAAAADYIGEAGGTEAGEKAAELSAKQVRSEIHEHVAVIYSADIRDVRKDFAPDGDAFLNDPCAVLS